MKKPLLKIAAMAVLLMAAMTTGHAQIPITLETGWNWISYPYSEPMTIQEALAGFIPANGDIIQAQSSGNATYRNGRWMGQLTTLVPGEGYMYQSVYGGTRYFIFGGANNDPSVLPEAALDGDFTVDANGTKVRFSPGNLQCLIDPDMDKEAVVGTSTAGAFYLYPYNTYYCYSLCEMLYTAEELAAEGLAPGPIKSIAFQSNSDLCLHRNNIRVWIANTTATTVSSTSVSASGMTKVFEGSITQQPGWTEIPCGGTFRWDGTSNVRVTVVMNHGDYDSPCVYWLRTSTNFTGCGYAYNDNNAYAPEANTYSLYTASYRPNIRFKGNGVRWRFAENQTDYIGEANANIGPNYNGWIDLFGWGTSGYNHGAVCYQPWSTNNQAINYYAYGSATYNLYDQTGQADWGYNPISNGGNQPNQWRTLTKDEWNYVSNTRATPSGIRYAKATVDGVTGLILLPDNWQTSYYSLNSTNTGTVDYSTNTITATQWSTLEQHGAVFLPAAGYRNGTSVSDVGSYGRYWSASDNPNSIRSIFIGFDNSTLTYYYALRSLGASVRLVCQSNPRIRTIGVSNVQGSAATVTAEVDCTGSATVGERGVCWAPFPSPSVGNSHATSGTGTGGYSVNLSNLASGTTYYVRAYATIGDNTVYGNELSFISQANPITVTTSSVSNVKQTTAMGGGSLSGNGVSTMTECGICWSTLHNPTTSDRHATNSNTGEDSFTCTMTGLTASTTYYVRAYATNSAGTSYGSEVSFTTSAVAAPTVTTSEATDITLYTATVSGTVTNEGGAPVTERGICWGISSNPTISGSHQSAGTGLGSFTFQLTGLDAGTTYYVRAYATNSQGTAYGSQKTFTTTAPPTGTIKGLFSVSATQQVRFSRGNLQYKASTNTWRFATNQYNYIGTDNLNASPTYSGWIDVFGWGTSGWNSGNTYYHPWDTNYSDETLYGPPGQYNLTGSYANADWGVYNPISNGGNTPNQWRTLTNNEWVYVFDTRSTTSGIRYAKAKVNNVLGIILLPDNWSSSYYTLNNVNTDSDVYYSNVISASDWSTYLEAHGAVFLPAAGYRYDGGFTVDASFGYYWSASYATESWSPNGLAYGWSMGTNDFYKSRKFPRDWGLSVRLVRNAE